MLLDGLAGLVGRPELTDREVGAIVEATVRPLLHFDRLVVFSFRRDERPLHLFSTFSGDERKILVDLYQSGHYLLDPFYQASRERKWGLYRMQELAPDRFYKSEYYRKYYAKTGLVGEVAFLIPAGNDICVCVSFMRNDNSSQFRQHELSRLKVAEALIVRIVQWYWKGLDRLFDSRSEAGSRRRPGNRSLQADDTAWTDLRLTHREKEIIELVLQGHSSESIGLRLAIATGTVKVHRRNIYRKLGISSQTQLLSRYLSAIRSQPKPPE